VNYIIVGDTAYLSDFTGELDELITLLPVSMLNSLEVLGLKKICWGLEGEDWEYIEDIPRLAQ
jgi:hypothetical protein